MTPFPGERRQEGAPEAGAPSLPAIGVYIKILPWVVFPWTSWYASPVDSLKKVRPQSPLPLPTLRTVIDCHTSDGVTPSL